MSSEIIFEQPLNERIRTFMRIEDLYKRCNHYIDKDHAFDSHAAISTLFELLGLASRGDLKRELMKEIKRQITNLQQLHSIPSLDQNKLDRIIDSHNDLINQLDSLSGQLIGHLKENDFINSIKQRSTIPGGTCDFDLPAYHYWLTQAASDRKQTIESWLKPFAVINHTVQHCLELIRDSSEIENCVGNNGFYQRNLDQNQPNQLIRVFIDHNEKCFPEISAGKHRFSIRFLQQPDPNQYPKQLERDIAFKISCCAF